MLFLNCNWNGGLPYAQLSETLLPLRAMFVMRGGTTINDLIAALVLRSLMRNLLVVAMSTEKSSQLAPPVLSK